MPNPYPARWDELDGTARLEGEVTFTNPANQPGNGGTQPVEVVRLTVTPATSGLLIPASGPAGIELASLNEGDIVLNTGIGICAGFNLTPWDGSTPSLQTVISNANRGDLPGTPPTPLANVDLTLNPTSYLTDGVATAGSPFGGTGLHELVTGPSTLYVYLDDGSGGDPGSTTGETLLTVVILRAP